VRKVAEVVRLLAPNSHESGYTPFVPNTHEFGYRILVLLETR
jgi:hypothetical protein